MYQTHCKKYLSSSWLTEYSLHCQIFIKIYQIILGGGVHQIQSINISSSWRGLQSRVIEG